MVGELGTIITSLNEGRDWDNRTSGTTNRLYKVTYGNSTFVTVGLSGTVLTSSDGNHLDFKDIRYNGNSPWNRLQRITITDLTHVLNKELFIKH